jgi:hypothetical protein
MLTTNFKRLMSIMWDLETPAIVGFYIQHQHWLKIGGLRSDKAFHSY